MMEQRGGQVSTIEIAPWLLSNFGVSVPDYMRTAPKL